MSGEDKQDFNLFARNKSYLNSFLLLDFATGKILLSNILEEMIMIKHYKLLDNCLKRLSINLYPIILLWSDQKTGWMVIGWMMIGERCLYPCCSYVTKVWGKKTTVKLSATYLLVNTWRLKQSNHNHNVNVGLPWQNFSPRLAKVNSLQTVLILFWTQIQLVQI